MQFGVLLQLAATGVVVAPATDGVRVTAMTEKTPPTNATVAPRAVNRMRRERRRRRPPRSDAVADGREEMECTCADSIDRLPPTNQVSEPPPMTPSGPSPRPNLAT